MPKGEELNVFSRGSRITSPDFDELVARLEPYQDEKSFHFPKQSIFGNEIAPQYKIHTDEKIAFWCPNHLVNTGEAFSSREQICSLYRVLCTVYRVLCTVYSVDLDASTAGLITLARIPSFLLTGRQNPVLPPRTEPALADNLDTVKVIKIAE